MRSNTSVTYQNEIIIPFFNHYLKDKNDPSIAGATIFFTGENQWRRFDSWPSGQIKEEKIYLTDKKRTVNQGTGQ
ncbi:MAG: hypothetical protein WDM78_24415 [Puia sp.]